MTTLFSVIDQRLSEQLGDFLEVAVTTDINGDNLILSTTLRSYDGGRDDYFIDWWVYITDKANIGVLRQVSDYATASGTLTVRGAVLADDGAVTATIRLYRYDFDKKLDAINDTIREIFPDLHRKLDDHTLVTGNMLPNAHFEDWAATTIPDKYTAPTGSVAAVTTAAYIRGGAKSAYLTGGATPDYFYITSDDYPRLLDLMGRTITFRSWAYPVDTADDATIQIYTLQADGTAQTLTSTTANPKGAWTLLELEDQDINDDLFEIQFRFRVKTTAKHVYFDNARVTGRDIFEFLLPTDFDDGDLRQVHIQTSGYSDQICDDLQPRFWERIWGYEIVSDGTDKFLRLPSLYSANRQIRLMGICPLETLTGTATVAGRTADYATTLSIDGRSLNLFIAYAKYKWYQMIEGPVSSQDVGRYETNSAKAYGEYMRLLPHLRMSGPPHTMKLNI